ncbi:hypothetical protein KIN20_001869 [Parelaphostrongylus tenuis]|uniref:Uncharacterized protein n=1 Tax=Parelaphostrongylus tenuis TaxID=148309 RepID=A0AAD5LWV7_PARTN|nr:hypothetical protein KIN20_001869 [Parelaphostrongylus tenuis]
MLLFAMNPPRLRSEETALKKFAILVAEQISIVSGQNNSSSSTMSSPTLPGNANMTSLTPAGNANMTSPTPSGNASVSSKINSVQTTSSGVTGQT